MGTARRGRPQRPADDAVTDGNRLRLRSRIAWLLRVNRLYGGGAAWISAASFAAAFAGGSHPDAVSQSKISRWETGLVNVPYSAIRRYEELLGSPARSLSSTIDVVSRYMSTQAGQDSTVKPWLSRAEHVSSHRLDDFLDQVASTSVMTAADWDDLSTLIASTPGLRLRRKEWDQISSRLLVETVSADGEAWKPRFEAFTRLLCHSGGQQAAIAACAAWGRCRENHAAIEVLSLLDICRHSDSASAVLDQLTNPVKDDAFAGALLASVRKVAEGHFSPEQIKRVAAVSMDVLSAHADPQIRINAATVLNRLPPHLRSSVSRRLNSRAYADALRQDACPELNFQNSYLNNLITARSSSLLAREGHHFEDRVLPVLIYEMIFSPLSDTRLYAAFLIRGTPYRRPVADSLTWAMKRIPGARGQDTLIRLISALRIIGEVSHRQIVENFTDLGISFTVQDTAIQALGHMGGKSDAVFWRKIFDRQTFQPSARDSETEKILIHAAYSVGMKRQVTELHHISEEETLPGAVRASAKWWLDLPTHMFISAEK